MLSISEKEEMFNVYKSFKPPLKELNQGLDPSSKLIEYEPKKENDLEKRISKCFEDRLLNEFNQFQSYNDELKLTKKMQELNEKGLITINYGNASSGSKNDEELISIETKEKAKYLGFGFLIGIIFTILLA
jgi:hypothetical protein